MAKQTKQKEQQREQEQEPQSKLRIRLKAYDHEVLDKSAEQIIETAFRYGVEVVGPVPLPTEIHKYTVHRSPHAHEDSRDQFERRIHKRLIDVIEPNQKLIEALMNINLPAGVDIEIEM